MSNAQMWYAIIIIMKNKTEKQNKIDDKVFSADSNEEKCK